MTAVKQTYWWHSAGVEAAIHDIKEAKQKPSRESPKMCQQCETKTLLDLYTSVLCLYYEWVSMSCRLEIITIM